MVEKMELQAILFDLDETLLDRASSLDQYMRDQYKRYEKLWGHVGVERFCERFEELDGRGYVSKRIVYRSIFEEFGGEGLTEDMMLAEFRRLFCRFVNPFEGVREVLTELRRRGFKLGVITNGETEFQQRNMEVLGIPEWVDTILISQKEGLRKPDGAIFRLACKRLGVAPEACLFIGDNPRNDIGGAKSVGMKTGWFTGSGMEWPEDLTERADHEVERLVEILELGYLPAI
ncbi:MAG TPA: HAD family hydrolase [Bacilli bacterium]|nr:HAD family hydrolase [Bacilli bacterium]